MLLKTEEHWYSILQILFRFQVLVFHLHCFLLSVIMYNAISDKFYILWTCNFQQNDPFLNNWSIGVRILLKQWTSPGERAPKKAKNVLSTGKIMATVFWDSQGVINIDYLEKGKTVTELYYAKLLDRFDAELQKKRSHLTKKKCSSFMTTHRFTLPPSPWPNWSN